MSLRERVAGVDFSGARDAGKNIWIAEGIVTTTGVKIERLQRAADLTDGGTAFAPALNALVGHVETLNDHVDRFRFSIQFTGTADTGYELVRFRPPFCHGIQNR